MPHNENSRVKIPALVHFTRLGYKYISLRKYEGVIDDDTNILVDVFCDAINRINATSLTTTDVQKIVNALKAMLENDDLGREFYSVLINGYNGLKLIDFEDFGGTVNSYHVVTEMNCKNGSDEFRPDITPLINGIPLAFIEVKKPNNKGGIKAEYDRMLMRVKNKKFRRFINLTQIMVFSNNSEYDDTEAIPLEGAFYSTISYEKLFFSHFREEDEKLLTSVPEKDEAVENFILTDNNLSSIKYSPEYVTNSSPVSPTNRIITCQITELDGHRMTAPCPETKYIPYRNYSDPNICLRYYVTSDFLYLLLRFLEHHIGNANGNEAQYATRRLLDVVLLFDSNEDAEDFATYIHRHLGTFDSKVLEQREPYIANETDIAAKALAQEIRNSQALKEMQPEWELFRLENA